MAENNNKAFEQLNKELAKRKAMVKRGENVREAKHAITMIEKKMSALKTLS